MYDALSTLPKLTAPSIEPSSGQYWPFLTCHKILLRSFVNSTMTWKHVCGSTTGCTRGSSQGLRQVCVLAPLLFNIFFAVVIDGVYTRFKEDGDITDAFVHLRKMKGVGGGGQRKATTGELALVKSLWGILYADKAEVVSHFPEQQRKMVGVIVIVCALFGLAV